VRRLIARVGSCWPGIVLSTLALLFGAAALVVALRGSHQPRHSHAPPRTHAEICSLLGAMIGDRDVPDAMSAAAVRLYNEDGC